jgi:hypothetical protein
MRRRRRFSGPSSNEHKHAALQFKCRSSGTGSAHATTRPASGAATAAIMMVLAMALLGATAPRAVSAGWIDPDTPEEMKKTLSLVDKTEYELVSLGLFCG